MPIQFLNCQLEAEFCAKTREMNIVKIAELSAF